MKLNLLKINLVLSILGIFFLLILTNLLQPKLVNISNIDKNLLNKKIKINGEILNIKKYPSYDFQIILVKDKTGEIRVIIDRIIPKIKKGHNITIIGIVQEYKKEIQIQAEKILLMPPP